MNSSSRKRPRILWYAGSSVVLAGLAVGFWSHFQHAHSAAHDHSHGGHDAHPVAALSLDDGKRWETDQALRTGMERIRAAAAPVLAAHAGGQVSPEQAKAMADAIQESVIHMVANCKLTPKADATLHVFITDLMSGAGLLAANPSSREAVALISEALRRYPEYFDHPGWVPVTMPAS